ncbi:MAG: SRPBCC family protein [Actinomycetota bacterium]|nr:SRPBCC family protein [Actinomycetota bacterium]
MDRSAPATAEGELQIAAPPETVWAVISDLPGWPSWNSEIKSITLEGPVAPGTVFRWKSKTSLVSKLEVVDPPREIAWTGVTMRIRAVHVFRFEPRDGGTLAHSEESWRGLIPSVLKGYSRKTLQSGIDGILKSLKMEAERRAS